MSEAACATSVDGSFARQANKTFPRNTGGLPCKMLIRRRVCRRILQSSRKYISTRHFRPSCDCMTSSRAKRSLFKSLFFFSLDEPSSNWIMHFGAPHKSPTIQPTFSAKCFAKARQIVAIHVPLSLSNVPECDRTNCYTSFNTSL